mmetsp:Transcript_15956/g.24156  ORF Transcript_15956/g.24156 Transcript_15956/m.24156 type:complete len:365 (-) Transcript_15956:77-1171(-)
MSSSESTSSAQAAATTTTTTTSLSARILSGSIGSIVTALTITPLEVVKVRQQIKSLPTNTTVSHPAVTATGQLSTTACPSCGTTNCVYFNNGLMECLVSSQAIAPKSTATAASATRSGTFSMLRQIFLSEGLVGIYAGLRPTLVMSIPNTVLYFTTYDELSSRMKHRYDDAWWIPLVSGSSARLLASGITAPFELIRTRQAISSSSLAASMWQDMSHIVRTEGGVSALYQGLAPTLWRDVPFSAIYWYQLEYFQRTLWEQQHSNTNSAWVQAYQSFINGALSGMIAAACTTPFDVVKTRRQQILSSSSSSSSLAESTYGTMQSILQTEGLTGLWRGNATRMFKVAPACAIMISCYEVGKLVLWK